MKERREQILQLLQDDGRVVAADLPGRLGVSLDTVRRDLDEPADHTKLGTAGQWVIGPVEDVDVLVTDHEADPGLVAGIEQHGVEVVLAR